MIYLPYIYIYVLFSFQKKMTVRVYLLKNIINIYILTTLQEETAYAWTNKGYKSGFKSIEERGNMDTKNN